MEGGKEWEKGMLLRGIDSREGRGRRVKEKRDSTYWYVFPRNKGRNQSTMVFFLLFFTIRLLLFYLQGRSIGAFILPSLPPSVSSSPLTLCLLLCRLSWFRFSLHPFR